MRIPLGVLGFRVLVGHSTWTVGTFHPREEPDAERSLLGPPCQGLLCLSLPWEAKCGCVFVTDNLVCCTCLYQVMCWPRKQLRALYFEVTPCRWKHLAWILQGPREARKRKSLRPGNCLCNFGEVGKSEMWSLLSAFHRYYIIVHELVKYWREFKCIQVSE